MADVEITIAGRRYAMSCRDGEEAQLARLAGMVDAKADHARRAASSSSGLTEVRQLLFAALFLADELDEARRQPPAGNTAPPPVPTDDRAARALESLALRLETVVERLAPGASAS